MILQVCADARPIGDDADAEMLQMLRGTDAGALQNCGRVQGAGGDNDFAAVIVDALITSAGRARRSRGGPPNNSASTKASDRIRRFGRRRTSGVR